jgi:hypothetical protein
VVPAVVDKLSHDCRLPDPVEATSSLVALRDSHRKLSDDTGIQLLSRLGITIGMLSAAYNIAPERLGL